MHSLHRQHAGVRKQEMRNLLQGIGEATRRSPTSCSTSGLRVQISGPRGRKSRPTCGSREPCPLGPGAAMAACSHRPGPSSSRRAGGRDMRSPGSFCCTICRRLTVQRDGMLGLQFPQGLPEPADTGANPQLLSFRHSCQSLGSAGPSPDSRARWISRCSGCPPLPLAEARD